ncbi:MAG: arginine deiminase family protein [Nocardioides sp.]
MWVENAQRDHADFVNKMTQRGVEVVELHDLVAQTMAIPKRGRGCWIARWCPTRSASAWSTAPAPSWSRWSRRRWQSS